MNWNETFGNSKMQCPLKSLLLCCVTHPVRHSRKALILLQESLCLELRQNQFLQLTHLFQKHGNKNISCDHTDITNLIRHGLKPILKPTLWWCLCQRTSTSPSPLHLHSASLRSCLLWSEVCGDLVCKRWWMIYTGDRKKQCDSVDFPGPGICFWYHQSLCPSGSPFCVGAGRWVSKSCAGGWLLSLWFCGLLKGSFLPICSSAIIWNCWVRSSRIWAGFSLICRWNSSLFCISSQSQGGCRKQWNCAWRQFWIQANTLKLDTNKTEVLLVNRKSEKGFKVSPILDEVVVCLKFSSILGPRPITG